MAPTGSVPEGVSFRSLAEVMEKLPQFRWKVHDAPHGGKTAFAITSGNRETGELHVLAVLENAQVPGHEHIAGGPYGELILTIAGELYDMSDEGRHVYLKPGDVLIHAGGTSHMPHATFWFGYYHQPRGSHT